MDDFYNSYSQKLTADINCRVRAKEIYQFEGITSHPDYADRNAQELACFYAMCGNYRFGQYRNLNSALALVLIQQQKRLPYHNAIAFFQGVKELDFTDKLSYTLLNKLLPYVLSSRGFVFSTSFYAEGLYCLHPCDLDYTTIEPYDARKVYANVLRSQAELRIGRSFQEEKNFYSRIIYNLSHQKEQIECWLTEAENEHINPNTDKYPPPWKGDIEEIEGIFWSFFEIYSTYCESQVNQASQTGSEDISLIRDELSKLKKAAQFIIGMERILRSIEAIKKVKDKNQNIQNKIAWLNSFRAEILTDDMQLGLKVLVDISNIEDFPQLYDLITRQDTLSTYQLKNYPILDKNLPVYKLGNKEGKELRWHRRTGIGSIIDWLYRGAKKRSLRKIMPFYLLDLFANDMKPLRPFKRNPHYFRPSELKFQGEISFCPHPTVIRKQESHYNLYQGLLAWCDRYFKGEWDRSLCNALYTFYRRHLVTQPPSKETNFLCNDLSVLKDALQQIFDMSPAVFPQRTQMEISMNEFYDFYYYNPDPDIKAVRKALRKLVTDEDANEYKELAFLDKQGIGYSFHPDAWFDQIENWVSKIESQDKTVLEYINKSNADAAFHQAQIDLAIQFICSQKIRENMVQEVLVFCKRVFSPGCK